MKKLALLVIFSFLNGSKMKKQSQFEGGTPVLNRDTRDRLSGWKQGFWLLLRALNQFQRFCGRQAAIRLPLRDDFAEAQRDQCSSGAVLCLCVRILTTLDADPEWCAAESAGKPVRNGGRSRRGQRSGASTAYFSRGSEAIDRKDRVVIRRPTLQTDPLVGR